MSAPQARQRAPFAALMVAVGFAAFGCSVLIGPDLPDLPPQSNSLDPADLRYGEELWRCGDWVDHVRPSGARMLVDVSFAVNSEYGLDLAGPSAVHGHLVRQRDAAIVYEYNITGYRVWMPVDSIPSLARIAGVRDVPDPSRYDVQVFMTFRSRFLGSADSMAIRQLGGLVRENLNSIGAAYVFLPDASVPALRQLPDVEYVIDLGGAGCVIQTLPNPIMP